MTQATLEYNAFVRHRYGGIYRVAGTAISTVDGKSEVVIYQHVYPFETKLWVRPIEEWTNDRFVQITPQEVAEAFDIPRDVFADKVIMTKLAARSARV